MWGPLCHAKCLKRMAPLGTLPVSLLHFVVVCSVQERILAHNNLQAFGQIIQIKGLLTLQDHFLRRELGSHHFTCGLSLAGTLE